MSDSLADQPLHEDAQADDLWLPGSAPESEYSDNIDTHADGWAGNESRSLEPTS